MKGDVSLLIFFGRGIEEHTQQVDSIRGLNGPKLIVFQAMATQLPYVQRA